MSDKQPRRAPSPGDPGAVIGQWMPLIASVAARFDRCGVPIEDLVQVGVIGYLEAASTFDPAKARFTTFVTLRVRGAIVDALRNGLARMIHIPRDALKAGADVACVGVESAFGAVSQWRDPSDRMTASELLARLPRKHAEMLRLYYGLGDARPTTQVELARRFGLSESRVSQIIIESLDELRASCGLLAAS